MRCKIPLCITSNKVLPLSVNTLAEQTREIHTLLSEFESYVQRLFNDTHTFSYEQYNKINEYDAIIKGKLNKYEIDAELEKYRNATISKIYTKKAIKLLERKDTICKDFKDKLFTLHLNRKLTVEKTLLSIHDFVVIFDTLPLPAAF